jgi:ubiquinone/menaquinone biosynthesis C-methylase UbiE
MMKSYYEKYWQGTLGDSDALYADPPTWPETETRRLLKAMDGVINGSVLDAGCGDGTFDRIICSHHPDLTLYGMDISRTAVSKAGRNQSLKRLSFLVGDVVSLPLKDRMFDCVILVEVIEHVFDVTQLLGELKRVLKDGGKLFITTTDFNLLKKMIVAVFLFERYFYPTNPHIRIFTRKSLKDILQKSGFKVLSYRWNGSYFGIMPMGQIVICEKVKS